MLRRAFCRIVALVLWLAILACLAIVIAPHFLDRIYYRGPAGGHFDGARFFNPDGDDTTRPPTGGSRAGFFWRQLAGDDRPPWPDGVPSARAKPAPRVMGDAMVATWVGHATVLIQTNGLNILTDPIWADTAGPFGLGPRRVTRPGVALSDLPKIDLIVVSHNHYDHMDLATLKQLWDRDRPTIVTSLGNDAILRAAGIGATALDWGGQAAFGWRSGTGPAGESYRAPRPCCAVRVVRNHHWGSRWFADRNRALWSAFVIETRAGSILFAGDTGLGDGRWPAEARAAARGPIRLAIIPIGAFRFEPGQLGTASHIGPPDAVRVFDRLGASLALPIHWGTFRLSYEARETPPRLLDVILRCAGGDPARFAARPVGVPFAEPPATAPGRRPDEARIAACTRLPAARALR